jgi:hypothetical protein
MDLEKIKNYLQTYLNDVLTPTINRELVGEEDEPITLTVHALRKGSYQPPIFHVFIDIDPNWQGSLLKRLEKDIEDFIKIFSIKNKVKVHWNKRPLF